MPATRPTQVYVRDASRTDECGLCLERSPRQLPCSHSFCVGCLKQVLRIQPASDSFPCPTCRSPADIPPGGIEDLQSGFNWEVGLEKPSDGSSNRETRLVEGERNLYARSDERNGIMAEQRACTSHPGELFRFYCMRCATPICRDCKLSSHESHPATSLQQKSAEAKNIITLVTQMSRNNLESKLQQRLAEAKSHKKSVEEKLEKILGIMESRAEYLKEKIDQALSTAKKQAIQETANVDALVTTFIDSMAQGLASLISFTDHAQSVANSGCDADVVEVLPQMKKLFSDAEQEDAKEDFEILEDGIAPPCEETNCRATDGPLASFLTDDWRMTVQLYERTATKQCPFCSFKFSSKTFSCPRCCPGTAKTRPRRNFFGFRGGKQASSPQVQCQVCSRKYDPNCDFCPNCVTPPSQDPLTLIKAAIPKYIGHASQKRQEAEEGESRRRPRNAVSGSSPRGGEDVVGQKGGVQLSMSQPSVRAPLVAGAQAQEVFNTICTINFVLQAWK